MWKERNRGEETSSVRRAKMQKSEQAEKVHFLSLLVLLLQRGSTSTLKSRVTVKVGIRIEISAEYQEASCKLEFIIHSFWKETEVFSKALKIVLDRNEEASEEIQLEIQQNKWDTRMYTFWFLLQEPKRIDHP